MSARALIRGRPTHLVWLARGTFADVRASCRPANDTMEASTRGGQAMSSGSHPWTSQTLATGLLPFLPGWALRRVWPGRSGAAEVARATFTLAFDGTHSPPKAAGANLQLLCRLLDLGVSSLAPSSASASLQLPAPGAHRGGGRALPSRASSSRVHRALHNGLACSAARSNHRSLG